MRISEVLRELERNIAVSLALIPCDYETLNKRDFLKSTSYYGVDFALKNLEQKGIIYYTSEGEIRVYAKHKEYYQNLD